MSRRCASPMALKTSAVVEERATQETYSYFGICQGFVLESRRPLSLHQRLEKFRRWSGGSRQIVAQPRIDPWAHGLDWRRMQTVNGTAGCSPRRAGRQPAARTVQDLFLEGKRREAAAAVPDAFVDDMALVGPKERIADRLDAWRESGVTTMLVSTRDERSLRMIAELVL
jgi:alkanesulfonate monooxygenase SsuD/methylene tetrahydromethanopterin reductase-like flavin-dependent oxidoreductase (luciferase family)